MRTVKNKSFIIFGSTGDLVKRKILPSLFFLSKNGHIKDFKIFCIGRRDLKNEDYIKNIEQIFLESIKENNNELIESFYKNIIYIKADFDCKDCVDISPIINNHEKINKLNGRIFYLSVPANTFKNTISLIEKEGLINKKSKILVEKPFGEDLDSSIDLDIFIKKHFSEKQVYIIDHYLSKEVVLNILDFRKSKNIKNIFNNKFIEKVDINIFEKIGVEGRCDFYNNTGALRDFFQNHVLQLISLLFLDTKKNDKVEVLNNLEIIEYKLKQYKKYKDECGDDSKNIETGFSMIINIKNKDFDGININLNYAKNMAEKITEIRVFLKDSGHIVFDIQNNKIDVKSFNIIKNIFDYTKLKNKIIVDDYKKIILDSLLGNKKNFVSFDFIKKSWEIVDNIKKESRDKELELY